MTLFDGFSDVMQIIYVGLSRISFFGVSIVTLIYSMVVVGLLISIIKRLEK